MLYLLDMDKRNKNIVNYAHKHYSKMKEDNDLQLRKQKLNSLIMNKRIQQTNTNSICQLEIKQQVLNDRLPSEFVSEFDSYEGKYDLILQYLNDDFSSLVNMQFVKEEIVLFALIKVKLCFYQPREINPLFESPEYETKLYKSLLNILMTTSNLHFIYEVTSILINYCADSPIGSQAMLNQKLWQRLCELYTIGSIDLNANIIWMFCNVISEEEIALKIFSTINFDKLILDYMTQCKNNYGYYHKGLELLQNLFRMNKKVFIIRQSFLYPNLLSTFQDQISLLTVQPICNDNNDYSKINNIEKINRQKLIEELSLIFHDIVKVEGEHISLFFGEGFVFSVMKLIKAYIYNPIYIQYLQAVELVYKLISNLIEIGSPEEISIISKQGFLPLTELLINTTIKTPEGIAANGELLGNICFCLSNYVVDSSENANSIIQGSSIVDLLKAVLVLKEDKHFTGELLYVFTNAFIEGNKKAKENLISIGFEYVLSLVFIDQINELVLTLVLKLIIRMLDFTKNIDSIQLLKMMRISIDNCGLVDFIHKFEHCNMEEIEELACDLKTCLY